MSYATDTNQGGIGIAQDHDPTMPLEIRSTKFARRVLERDRSGEYIYEEDSMGDVEPNVVLWKRASKTARPYSAWAPCYAAVVVPAQGPDIASGGGFCPSASGSGGSVLPVGSDTYAPDARFEAKNPAWPEDQGEFSAKSPQGTVGIVLGALSEDRQQDLFLPIDNRLVAVNFAGDPDMGSRVYDLTNDFKFDPTRFARLQTAMRVIKQPLGAANSLALQIGPTG